MTHPPSGGRIRDHHDQDGAILPPTELLDEQERGRDRAAFFYV
jgi:hypothetical protein